MSNEVLALKYRPKTFNDLIGQESVSKTLSLGLQNNQLANVYLFSGLRGSGKTSTARIMAKALVCVNAPTPTPCDKCLSCLDANKNKNIDIIELDGASHRGIDSIKELIEDAQYKPVGAKFKVFIIDEVHMLTREAFNSLLKTLEEPPPYLKFILATTDPLKVPATVLSRTQHYRFNKITLSDLKTQFIYILNLENVSYDDASIEILARNANGSLRDGITLLEQAVLYCKQDLQNKEVSKMLGLIKQESIDEIFDYIFNNKNINELIDRLSVFECDQILNELGIYFKEKLIGDDNKFNVSFLDEFLDTIVKAKELLFVNSDESFVLSFVLFKMQSIFNKNKDKNKSNNDISTSTNVNNNVSENNNTSNTIKTQTTQKPKQETPQEIQSTQNKIVKEISQTNKQAIQNTTIPKQNKTQIIQEPQQNISSENNAIEKFKKVASLVYEKDNKLGECFNSSFFFSKFENSTLTLVSKAQGECKELLRQHYNSFILLNIKLQFGNNVKITFDKQISVSTNQQTQVNQTQTNQTQQTQNQQNQPQQNQPSPTNEQLMNDPMVQKSMELFQPKDKIQIVDTTNN
jgi:DNA polymerase-3 subunit gamma/tau